MNPLITPHEPEEYLLSSVDEIFEEAMTSDKYWQRQEKKRMKSVQIEMPEAAYWALADVAQQQGKTAAQVAQTLMNGILSTLLPSAHLSLRESSSKP
ncbi:MAG: hypothetical protein AAB354_00355 [candidate division KSB1 bacterium]